MPPRALPQYPRLKDALAALPSSIPPTIFNEPEDAEEELTQPRLRNQDTIPASGPVAKSPEASSTSVTIPKAPRVPLAPPVTVDFAPVAPAFAGPFERRPVVPSNLASRIRTARIAV